MSERYDPQVIDKIKQLPGTPTLQKRQIWILYFIYHVMDGTSARYTDIEQANLMAPATLSRHLNNLVMFGYLRIDFLTPGSFGGYFLSSKGKRLINRLYPKEKATVAKLLPIEKSDKLLVRCERIAASLNSVAEQISFLKSEIEIIKQQLKRDSDN